MSRYSTGLLSLLYTCFLLAFSSCQNDGNNETDNTPNLRTLSAAEQQVATAVNEFSFSIFSRINEQHQESNIFISPFSISTALSMTANGAKGETNEEMKEALALNHLTDAEMNQAYRDLVELLLGLDNKVKLQIANSNWYRDLYHIRPDFQEILLEYYEADVKPANFDDPATKDQINQWIENKTNGKIKNMLDGIPSDAVMYLINAIYFKADWQYKFDENKTDKALFHTHSGEVETDMMFAPGAKVSYLYDEAFTLVDLPYGNGQFSMTILMEKGSGHPINEVIQKLTPEDFASYVNRADTTTAEIYLPKFKMEFKKLLNEILIDMGMGLAFGNGATDFSGLFEEDLPLAISRVLHQSFIEVNEKGSEAAAATIVEIAELSAGPDPGPKAFHINRPFAFFIREKHSNAILFAGKMLNPAGE